MEKARKELQEAGKKKGERKEKARKELEEAEKKKERERQDHERERARARAQQAARNSHTWVRGRHTSSAPSSTTSLTIPASQRPAPTTAKPTAEEANAAYWAYYANNVNPLAPGCPRPCT